MESPDSPFTELDVYADWSGDPAEEAEVKVVLEVRSSILKLAESHGDCQQLITNHCATTLGPMRSLP